MIFVFLVIINQNQVII